MNGQDTGDEKAFGDPTWRGVGLYAVLLALQTAGVVLVLVNIVPLYRLMALDFANYKPNVWPWGEITGTLVIHAAYWSRVWLQPPLPRSRNVVLGHLVQFSARLLFVSVTAAFTVMFMNRLPQLRALDYSPLRALLVLVMFFGVFCWTLELERLAAVLQKPGSPGKAAL